MSKLTLIAFILCFHSVEAQTLLRVDSFSVSDLKKWFYYEPKDSSLKPFYKRQKTNLIFHPPIEIGGYKYGDFSF